MAKHWNLVGPPIARHTGKQQLSSCNRVMDTFAGALADGVGGSPKYRTSTGTTSLPTNQYAGPAFGGPEAAGFLTPVAVLTAGAAFAKARVVAEGVYVARVDEASMPTRAVALLRWDELSRFATAEGLDWPWEATRRGEWERFARSWEVAGISSICEAPCGLDCFAAQVFNGTHPPC